MINKPGKTQRKTTTPLRKSSNSSQADSEKIEEIEPIPTDDLNLTSKSSCTVQSISQSVARKQSMPAKDAPKEIQIGDSYVDDNFEVESNDMENSSNNANSLVIEGKKSKFCALGAQSIESNEDPILSLAGMVCSLDNKIDKLLINQQQIVLNQIKAKVNNNKPVVTTDKNWAETKATLAAYFKNQKNAILFEDFDTSLSQSKRLRARVVRYLKEKIEYGDWKLTARLLLNASMQIEVQQQYSGKGQKGKKSLKDTNLYPILEALIQSAVGKEEKVSERAILTYVGEYIKTSKGRAKGYAAKGKKKTNTIGVVAELLGVGASHTSDIEFHQDGDADNQGTSKQDERKLPDGIIRDDQKAQKALLAIIEAENSEQADDEQSEEE